MPPRSRIWRTYASLEGHQSIYMTPEHDPIFLERTLIPNLTKPLPVCVLNCAKFQLANCFSLFLILDLDIPHSRGNTLVSSKVSYHKGVNPLLMEPGAEGMPQKVRPLLALGNAR